jgi:putative transcriptional regulator
VRTKDFARLTTSIKQAGEIRRGRRKATRTVEIEPADVRMIRDKLGRSQAEFALMIGVSVATLQNWEQGRRHPVGPARALLKVVATNPRLVMRALAS